MATVDEKVLKASIMRAVLVARYGRTLGALAQRRLSRLQREIVKIVNEEFGDQGARALQRAVRRAETAINEAYADIAALLLADLNGFAAQSREVGEQQIKRLIKRIAENVLTGGDAFDVKRRPILGRTVQDWITDAGAASSTRITAAITAASIDGRSAQETIKTLETVGFRPARNGLNIATKAAVHGVEAYTMEDIARDNADVVIALEWSATLDGKTCLVCAGRDGRWRAVGRGKPLPRNVPAERRLDAIAPPFAKPPEHPACRCVLIPITVASERIDELLGGPERAAVGERGPAPIPGGVDAEKFLDAQSDRFLFGTDLGVSRTKLFRSGLSLGQMVDKTGRRLRLDELEAKYPEFWERAGL